MSIAFDSSEYTNPASTSSATLAHTCTGSNLALLAFVIVLTNSDTITGVTYNGVSLTKVISSPRTPDGGRYHYMFVLLGPATGTHNIVVSSSASNIESVIAASYTGVNQGSLDVSGCPGTYASSVISLPLTTTVANDWIVYGAVASAYPFTPTNMTQRKDSLLGYYIYDTNGAIASGSYTASFTAVGLSGGGLWGVALKPGVQNLTLPIATAVYSITGQTVTMSKFKQLILNIATAVYNFTGFNVGAKFSGWINQTKPSTSWTNQAKNT